MVFNAAKDLVYTINGGNISSGGYRINKILNGKSKKKGKQIQGGGGYSSIFKEDSGIPIGLLFIQGLHHNDDNDENEHDNYVANCKNKNKENGALKLDEKLDENNKLVYASIMAESDDDDDVDGRGIELVITPSGIANPIEISSNEIDDELYDSLVSLVKSASGPGPGSESVVMTRASTTPFRKANATKKQNFGKHKDVEKVFQKRKTRSKRHH
jgi:hypothetical protein